MRIIDQLEITDAMLAEAAAWYVELHTPASWSTIHPDVLRVALELAGQEPRRIIRDGEDLIVYNHIVW